MNTNPTAVPSTIESLLAHADWVRALARHLVSDPQTAADVEQEVWRSALERPPRHVENPRGWLASAARNAARALKRGESRRTRREALAARPEALPSTARLVEEAALSRELAGIVLELDEPYRTTILLRYFRDLSVDAIAQAQNAPRESVRTRQRRALELLRQRLDATRGGRAAWTAAFAPLVGVDPAPVVVGSGYAGLGWALAALLLGAGAWFAWPSREAAPALASLPQLEPVPAEPATGLEAPTGAGIERTVAVATPARDPATAPATAAARSAPSQPVLGRVIDVDGRPLGALEVVLTPKYAAYLEQDSVIIPVPLKPKPGSDVDAGVSLQWGATLASITAAERATYARSPELLEAFLREHDDAPGLREAVLGLPKPRVTARTDADGRFSAVVNQAEWEVDVLDDHAVIVAEIGGRGTSAWTLVVAPAVHVIGYVVDDAGVPVPQAWVQHMTSTDALRDLLFEREVSTPRYSSATPAIDAQGRFELAKIPHFPRDTIEAQAEGYDSVMVTVPDHDTFDLQLVLKRRHVDERQQGRLRGIVLDAAGRPAGGANVYLGQDQCQSGADGRFELVLSCCHEHMPLTAVLQGFQPALIPEFGTSKTPSQDDLVLRLGAPTLSIRGRVVGPMGKPIARAHVQLLDGTAFSSFECFVEDASTGRYNSGVLSGADGTFELGGLSERDYRVAAWWNDSSVVISDPVPAGTNDLVLRPEPSRTWPELHGRVVSREGSPLPDVEVGVRLDTFRSVGSTSWKTFGRVTTDERGSFMLSSVPKGLVGLTVSGRSIRTQSLALPDDPSREFTITATLEVRVELEITGEDVDEVQFLDEAGKPVHVVLQLPGVSSIFDHVSRRDGAFPPFDVTDEAVTAVLRANKAEVRRVPVRIERASTLRLQL